MNRTSSLITLVAYLETTGSCIKEFKIEPGGYQPNLVIYLKITDVYPFFLIYLRRFIALCKCIYPCKLSCPAKWFYKPILISFNTPVGIPDILGLPVAHGGLYLH